MTSSSRFCSLWITLINGYLIYLCCLEARFTKSGCSFHTSSEQAKRVAAPHQDGGQSHVGKQATLLLFPTVTGSLFASGGRVSSDLKLLIDTPHISSRPDLSFFFGDNRSVFFARSCSVLCFKLIRLAEEVQSQRQRPERKRGVSPWSQIIYVPQADNSCLQDGKHSPLLIRSNHNRKSQRGGETWWKRERKTEEKEAKKAGTGKERNDW